MIDDGVKVYIVYSYKYNMYKEKNTQGYVTYVPSFADYE